MGKIVAIGGGDIRSFETLPIDREIVRLTRKNTPRVLFIPTASGEMTEYINAFTELYGRKLGCVVDVLLLSKNPPDKKEMEKKIFSSDIIYVGGGSTFRMMRVWKRLGVDIMLKKAYTKDIVLSGLSAGANCWFRYSHSDSRRYSNPANWKWIRVTGLGLVPFMLCPHYHAERREESFKQMIVREGGVGIALDNNTAIDIVDGKYKILKSKRDAKAYIISRNKNKIHIEEIQTDTMQSLPLSL